PSPFACRFWPCFWQAGNGCAATDAGVACANAMLSLSMANLCKKVFDFDAGTDILRQRRYGVIEVCGGRVVAIHLRPWPKLVSVFDVLWGQWYHGHVHGDRVRLFYNQPRRFPNFLTLKYVISARTTTWATFHRALATLDEIARIKASDALLCDAANF